MADIDEQPLENGHNFSDNEDGADFGSGDESEIEQHTNSTFDEAPLKSSMKRSARAEPVVQAPRPILPEQPDPKDLKVEELTPLSPEIISRQATINIGTIGRGFTWDTRAQKTMTDGR